MSEVFQNYEKQYCEVRTREDGQEGRRPELSRAPTCLTRVCSRWMGWRRNACGGRKVHLG